MVLGRLALAAGDSVSSDALIDGLWGTCPPADALNSLQVLVYRLRKALPDSGLLESAGTGYRLAVPKECVDVARFEALATRGGRELAVGAHEEASSLLGEALRPSAAPSMTANRISAHSPTNSRERSAGRSTPRRTSGAPPCHDRRHSTACTGRPATADASHGF
ncbi:AfsR/SARP family transcriptional regulator [Streptomyces sp. CA-132043]|uniref:AfsR/SARP family transcriptional regulator n=1 Tax=Streptomyces sp. CA-132043 TaxID=3240048 RepID=UPI003D93D726